MGPNEESAFVQSNQGEGYLRKFSKHECVKADSHGPDVNESCVIFGCKTPTIVSTISVRIVHSEPTLDLELLRRDIRLTAAQALAQMRLLFPAHAEDVRDTKVGDLRAHRRQQASATQPPRTPTLT